LTLSIEIKIVEQAARETKRDRRVTLAKWQELIATMVVVRQGRIAVIGNCALALIQEEEEKESRSGYPIEMGTVEVWG
jgi:hypothetical protein